MKADTSVDNILQKLKDECPLGFAIALHIRYTTPNFLFQTYPKDWINQYSQRGLVMFDPIVGWGFANTGSIRWSGLGEMDPKGVLEQAKAFDMNFGFAHALDVGNSRSVAGFSRSDREYTDDEITRITDLVRRLHDITAEAKTLSPETGERLRKMSIEFTHP
jgi:LuxR family transcriptional regulator